jgi:hypothetical protein
MKSQKTADKEKVGNSEAGTTMVETLMPGAVLVISFVDSIAVGKDRDRRIRVTSERGYVREKRVGAGWMLEESYVLPEGLAIWPAQSRIEENR